MGAKIAGWGIVISDKPEGTGCLQWQLEVVTWNSTLYKLIIAQKVKIIAPMLLSTFFQNVT